VAMGVHDFVALRASTCCLPPAESRSIASGGSYPDESGADQQAAAGGKRTLPPPADGVRWRVAANSGNDAGR